MTRSADIRISIVIPHLNQSEFLERCLFSLNPQILAMQGVEIIVVDNGSRELPVALCDRHPAVRLETEARPGPGLARNRGIAVARGKLLAFIDADCLAHENWLATFEKEFATNPATLIVGGEVRIGLADLARPTMLEAYESVFAYRQGEYIEKQGFSGTGNLAMRRDAFIQVGPFAGIEIAEDRDWGHRAGQKGLKIKYLPDMIVYHPARKTFDELRSKWDRHMSHDYKETGTGLGARLKWIGLSIAVAASSIIDIRKVIASKRIASWRERVLASAMLIKIRLYRAWKMLGLMMPNSQQSSRMWNRQ